MKLEVVVYTIEGALKAQEGGADRIVLCGNTGDGGTTPSPGVADVIRQNLTCDVYVMIRPRGGDFCYSRYEFHAMKRDISHFQKLSVDGLVFGILTPEGRIDVARCRELIAKTRPLRVTCSRAFDETRDPFEALEDCINAGFDRILTTGQRPTAIEGIDVLTELQRGANGRITIMAGPGPNESNVATLAEITKVQEFCFPAVSSRESEMIFRTEQISHIETTNTKYSVPTVDPEIIRSIRRILSK